MAAEPRRAGLFTTDQDLRAAQRDAARRAREMPPDERREHIENEREVREHGRWRHFAYLLFILPALLPVVYGIVRWLVTVLVSEDPVGALRAP